MKEKIPLKFTKTCPPPVEVWKIIDDTVESVSSELGVSVEEAKLRAFLILLTDEINYPINKMHLKANIDTNKFTKATLLRVLPIKVSFILHININLPNKVLDFIAEWFTTDAIKKYFPSHSDTLLKAVEVCEKSDKILNNIKIEIDESLDPIVVKSKEELKLVILSHMVEGISLPPLQKKEEKEEECDTSYTTNTNEEVPF